MSRRDTCSGGNGTAEVCLARRETVCATNRQSIPVPGLGQATPAIFVGECLDIRRSRTRQSNMDIYVWWPPNPQPEEPWHTDVLASVVEHCQLRHRAAMTQLQSGEEMTLSGLARKAEGAKQDAKGLRAECGSIMPCSSSVFTIHSMRHRYNHAR